MAAGYLAAEHRAGEWGFPLDDSWIHARFAANLAAGHGLAFNPGEPSTGSTAPLWTVVLALPMAAGIDVVIAAKLLGIGLAAITAVLAYDLARSLTGSRAGGLVAGLAVALSARLTWGAVSGMEVPLYTALSTLALLAFARAPHRGWVWGLLSGLSTLARPETGILFPILLGTSVWRPDGGASARERHRPARTAAAAFALVVGSAVLVNLVVSGRPLPSTFYAKTGGSGLVNALGTGDASEVLRSLSVRPFETLNLLVRFFFEQSALFFALALPGLLALLAPGAREARGAPAALVLISSPLAVAAVAPVSPYLMQEGRYVANLLVLFFVIAAAGATDLARRSRRPVFVWAIAGLALVRLLSQNVQFADRYAAQVDNINRMHVAMGRWIAAETGPDESVAVSDIGALGFFSNRRILDLEGLVTPSVLPYRADRRYVEFVERTRPALLVIFPEWYPELAGRPDEFREIHRITVPRVTAAHDAMVVYATPWRR
jgi:hypothetical protein